MNRRLIISSLIMVTALTGCGYIKQLMPEKEPEVQVPIENVAPPVKTDAERAARTEAEIKTKEEFGEEGGSYKEFENGIIGNGEESILFFHDPDNSACERLDASLTDWYAANYIPLSIYKVDHKSSAGLRNRFNVVQENTFVRINGSGDPVMVKSFPSEIELLNMLRP
ncbi:hypothetical protein HN512_03135 [Candidatus Peregrinibacteria bacterium]|nr:hypothetical protein [Candidatus Peregrinibacteria bacterium]MBT3598807.1 hypothetical protein [Candidatus Peregrinibacteria bacterium]MBT4366962.1 hypothetical protein [Candidatus Peregrinibacteria bacterium]MBT4585385.1 hypothetical protein [Candidatus Peregrinibacteria bacterium]MBT6731183.1 hypothetical protein [Candidatus Peregrinibacteria bacterium]